VFTSGFQCVKAYIHCILYISHRNIPSSKKTSVMFLQNAELENE
jgi:hypothetical protein